MPPCMLCESIKTSTAIYEDDLWHLSQFRTVPGFLTLLTKRHTGDVQTLSADELSTLGPVLARTTAALKEAASAERVYFATFMENNPHFHAVCCARLADIPAEHRGPGYLVNFLNYDGQDEESAAIANRVREALGSTAH